MAALARPVLAGNWKMHLDPAAARAFVEAFAAAHAARTDRTIVFFPPAISLAAAREAATARDDLAFGVQNVHWEEQGAFTGEISAPMAAAAGAGYALVGHSERRQLFGETDEETARKVRAALEAGLRPILCVGETLAERESGQAQEVVRRQLEVGLHGLTGEDAAPLLVAYEPVWAIGTGRTASPDDAAEMHVAIRALLERRFGPGTAAGDVPILYGGSVKPDNAAALLDAAEVDGVLVGGASLDPAGFARICTAG